MGPPLPWVHGWLYPSLVSHQIFPSQSVMDKQGALLFGNWRERCWRTEEGQPRAAQHEWEAETETREKSQSKNRESGMASLMLQLQ